MYSPEHRTGSPVLHDHPKNVYLPERAVLAPVNAWIGGLFDSEHRAATVEQLATAGSAASDNARLEQARKRLADTEKRLRRLQQAITKDLMARMGHDDMRAALIYQRATSEADRLIADRLSGLVDQHRGTRRDDEQGEDGSADALVPVS
ncbi:MAG: hypothetical protein ACRDRH_17620 [Pseudonocardia sp.]